MGYHPLWRDSVREVLPAFGPSNRPDVGVYPSLHLTLQGQFSCRFGFAPRMTKYLWRQRILTCVVSKMFPHGRDSIETRDMKQSYRNCLEVWNTSHFAAPLNHKDHLWRRQSLSRFLNVNGLPQDASCFKFPIKTIENNWRTKVLTFMVSQHWSWFSISNGREGMPLDSHGGPGPLHSQHSLSPQHPSCREFTSDQHEETAQKALKNKRKQGDTKS